MSNFANGTIDTCVVSRSYDSGIQYEMMVGGKKFKSFIKTGDYTPQVGDSVGVEEGLNDKGWKTFTVTLAGGNPAQQQQTTAKKPYSGGGYQKDPKTQATISYWAAEERAIQKLDSVVRNNIAILSLGKAGGMTQDAIKHLLTIEGFMTQVAEMTRVDLDVIADVENFNGELPTFTPPPPEEK